VFQDAGPETENDRGPRVDASVRGVDSLLASAERSRQRPETEASGTQ